MNSDTISFDSYDMAELDHCYPAIENEGALEPNCMLDECATEFEDSEDDTNSDAAPSEEGSTQDEPEEKFCVGYVEKSQRKREYFKTSKEANDFFEGVDRDHTKVMMRWSWHWDWVVVRVEKPTVADQFDAFLRIFGGRWEYNDNLAKELIQWIKNDSA